LDELDVLPDSRGAGIGETPVERVIRKAKEGGCRAIDLEVDQEHRSAENLHERNGFWKRQRNRWTKLLGEESAWLSGRRNDPVHLAEVAKPFQCTLNRFLHYSLFRPLMT
jgi:ribosomal protein S18 acetylase RimI-like enzyme